MRFVREELPARWAAVFINAEQLVVIATSLNDHDARIARRIMRMRCVGAFVILLLEELLAQAA